MVKYSVEAGCCFCQECQYACPVSAITIDKNGAHIDLEKCVGCGACMGACPVGAITPTDDGKMQINKETCISCGTCAAVCPVGAPVSE